MRSAQQWFDEYGESHRNPVNKAIHWLCVPAILFSSIGLFWAIPHDYFRGVLSGSIEPYLNWGTILVVLGLAFYLVLSRTIFLGMAVVSIASLIGNEAVAETGSGWQISAAIFGVAWFFQFVGHKIEGKKPSFFKDLQFLMIGPAWLLHFIYKKTGLPY